MRKRTALGFGLIGTLGSLVVGGFLGVSGSVRSPRAAGGGNVVYLFVDQNGQVSPAVQQGDVVVWGKLDTDGSSYAYVTDVNFRGTPPCGSLAKRTNPTNGFCILGASDGWYPYDCISGNTKDCTDPTLPIGSKTLPPNPGLRVGGALEEILRIYFGLARDFDGVLHFFWSSDDKPLEEYAPPAAGASPAMKVRASGSDKKTTTTAIDQTPVDGPLIRISVACNGNTITADQSKAEKLHNATTATKIPAKTTIVWDSAGGLGTAWSITDAGTTDSPKPPSLSAVCISAASAYTPDAVGTAGRCVLANDLASTINYQVVGVAGSCGASSATATLGPN